MKTYAVTLFIGAFLLFQVQPLMAKFILPWFGGSPAVWTTCMLFFQVFLLVGYAYAHASTRWLKPRMQVGLHLALITLALLLLPIIPGAHWKPVDSTQPVWHILSLLTVTLGLPYVVLAATSPLMQSWFYLVQPSQSPYRFFSISNAGSLLALVSYPFLFEPLFSRKTQAVIWMWALVCHAIFSCACAWTVWKASSNLPSAADAVPKPVIERSHKPVMVRLLWLALAACASVLLLGTTNKLCQNVAVIPFLWVLPLSLYLVTFILCFERATWYRRKIFMPLLVAVFVVMCRELYQGDGPLLWQISLYCSALFICCMVCHGELFQLRPEPHELTLFYLVIAAGGALGGVCVALVAPVVFKSFAELNWSLCALGILLLIIHNQEKTAWIIRGRRWPAWPWIGIGTAVLAVMMFMQSRRDALGVVAMSRNFFGTLRVEEVCEDDPSLHGYMFKHGTINHGAQFLDPVKARVPITYFNEESGVGLAMKHLPRQAERKIGIVGLGVGTLAAYGRAGDTFRFYEIDPEVEQIAKQWFTYLKNSAAKVEVVLGDGRLTMEREPDQHYDLLVLDAFSGDAPPVHLLTIEAFETYLRHLKPEGVIAVNISNSHVNFYPVMHGMVEHFGMGMGMIPWGESPMTPGLNASDWLLMTRNRAFLTQAAIISRARRRADQDGKSPLYWTDDATSLVQIMRQ